MSELSEARRFATGLTARVKDQKSKPCRDGCGDAVCSAAENFNGALVAPENSPAAV